MAGVSVMLAMPTHRPLEPPVVRSLLETQGLFFQRGIPVEFNIPWGSSLVHHARTKAAHAFLKSTHTHLAWVDSDISWAGADFVRLAALATKMECVGAIYTCKVDPPTFCLNVDDIAAVFETNEYGCFPLLGGGYGLGFTIVQRKIIEGLAAKAPLRRFSDIPEPIPYIFRCDDVGEGDRSDHAMGEDMSFFADIRKLGYVVNLDPTITLGHWGAKEYRASVLDYLVKA